MNSMKINDAFPLLLFVVTIALFVQCNNALLGVPPQLFKSPLYQLEDADRLPYPDGNLDGGFWTLRAPSAFDQQQQLFSMMPDKRNFYTHFWRNIAQRMPSYRGDGNNRGVSSLAEHPAKVDIDKRTPWIDRMNAIRTG